MDPAAGPIPAEYCGGALQNSHDDFVVKPWRVISESTTTHVPPSPDKSVTHRAIMLAAMAKGTSLIHNPLTGEDCLATKKVFEACGVKVQSLLDASGVVTWSVDSPGADQFQSPAEPLDLGNIKILRNQLREMDTEGVRTLGSDFQVVGIHFNHLDQDFRPIYSKLFSTGLSLFLLPSAPLKPEEIDRINEVLEKSPTHFLTALRQEYRVKAGYDTGSAGSLSVLMDNPYLPLPDIEYA